MTSIAVTALGLAGPLGDLSTAESRLFAGEPTLRLAASAAPWLDLDFDAPLGCASEAELARSFAYPGHLGQYLTRQLRVAVTGLLGMEGAIASARERWGPSRIALVVGSSTGGIEATEQALLEYYRQGRFPQDYSLENSHSLDAMLWWVSCALRIEGPGYVISTACSSSAKALAAGARLVRTGFVDAALIGGVDSLCRLTVRGFHSLGILSSQTCRPFMVSRNGLNIGEGAAWALLERDVEASRYLLGAGESSDAFHMTRPHPDGAGAIASMTEAVRQAGLSFSDIGYINAHGTGTPLNDLAEAEALRRVFDGGLPPTSSTKSLTAHQLGAAGMTEAIVCWLALDKGRTPVAPASGGAPKSEYAWLNMPDAGTSVAIDKPYALSNSFAFGGNNATLIIGARAGGAAETVKHEPGPVGVAGAALWGLGFADLAAWQHGFYDPTVRQPEARLLSARARGRASLLTRMFCEVVEHAARAAELDLKEAALVFASSLGEMSTTLELLQRMLGNESVVSPARFQLSVHNTALGALQIATGHSGFGTSISAGADTFAMALMEALAVLRDSGRPVVVACAEEPVLEPLSSRSYPPLAYALVLRAAAEAETATLEWLDGSSSASREPLHEPASALTDYFRATPIAPGLRVLSALTAFEKPRAAQLLARVVNCGGRTGPARWRVRLSG